MANELKARNGIPFDFVDGLRIKGVEVTKWTKVTRGPSSSRPTLGADDLGVLYMDDTLSSFGKPIWWNGSQWVDYSGIVV